MKNTTLTLLSVGFFACASACTAPITPEDPAGTGGNGSGQGGSGSGGRTATGGSPGEPSSSGGAPGNAGTGGATPAPGTGGSAPAATGGSSGGDASAPSEGGSPAPSPPGAGDPEQPATPAPTNLADHKFSKVIKMDTTAAGANVAAAVPKYPVAVVLTAENFDFSQAKDLGEDLRFSKMDGSPLPYNLESWDKTGKRALAWVRVDEVKGNDNAQSFLMHWGNPAAGSASDPKAVFPLGDGFIGVYHLNEEGNAEAGGYKDSSGHAAHMTGVMMAPGSRVDGLLGKATLLTNSKTDYKKQWIRLDGEKNAMFNAVGHAITASIWTKVNSFGGRSKYGSYETVFSKGDTSWTMQRVGSKDWEACTKGPGTVTWHNCAIIRGAVVTGEWIHFVLVLTDGGISVFMNGERKAGAGNGKRSSEHPYGIGQQTQALADGREWDGIVDEARVLSVAKDANWIKLDFESQKAGSKFLSFGPTQMK